MNKPIVTLPEFDLYAKRQYLVIDDPAFNEAIEIEIDWDDVDSYDTAMAVKKIISILNKHWNDAGLKITQPEGDENSDSYWEERNNRADQIMRELAGKVTE